jgi:hypothetical protein
VIIFFANRLTELEKSSIIGSLSDIFSGRGACQTRTPGQSGGTALLLDGWRTTPAKAIYDPF